tara:strand:+ start:642 stop:1061 length:420 start_codon:yes stop_codon:yes gene_type:complete
MFNFLKKKELKKNKNDLWIKTASLLIHAAKIDQNFTEKEKNIIKKTLIELGAEHMEVNDIIIKAEAKEEKSHQILEFTREIKNTDEKFKIKIVETLWKIIYSDESSDIYESNLMRRLTGLLYIDNKTMGDIKARIKKNN